MKKPNGYIAISTVLVLTVVVFVVGTSVSLLSINDIQSALSQAKSENALDGTESCVEEVLLQLNENNALPSSITIPQGTCSVTLNSNVGNNWTFTVTASFEGYTKSMQISADRTTTIDITRWTQL